MLVGVALIALSMIGCATNKLALLEALREYNDGVRWQRISEVGGFIHDNAKRAAFFARAENLSDVKVSDTRIRRVRLSREGKAYAVVSIDWYSLRTATVHRTLMRQTWDRKDGKWRLTDQRWVRGATFPLFASAPRRPASKRPQ